MYVLKQTNVRLPQQSVSECAYLYYCFIEGYTVLNY